MRSKDSKPYLVTRGLLPENQESPIHFLMGAITPDPYFYRRNHFSYPALSSQSFLLSVGGTVPRPLAFHYKDLLRMRSKEIRVVLECSGNNRAHFRPKVFGEQWEGGAISQGVWRGIALRDLLQLTGLNATAKEIVFEGRDYGKRTDLEGEFAFARSLPLKKALHPDTLIAYALNGKPIPNKHGYPLRLIVPQWYGMASVKWLRSITVIDSHFNGPFQDIDYVYYPEKDSNEGEIPVTLINVNSVIQHPLNWSILNTGKHQLYGIAWSGTGYITKIEVSVDGGENWTRAAILSASEYSYSWVLWTYTWTVNQRGEYTILSRATDSVGSVQPEIAKWNRKGYGYNACPTVQVKIE